MTRIFATIAILALLTGCAALPEAQVYKDYWWYARYRIALTTHGEVNWPADLLLADRIIRPVLERYRNDITLWRFHRRATDDVTGHQFSFIFYTDKSTAGEIFHSLEADPLTRELLQNDTLRSVIYDDLATNDRTALKDTSDERWSLPMQKHWPAYIMGVSELWLGMIHEYSGNLPDDTGAMLEEYSRINGKITALWHSDNRHALLHHLQAIFGYPAFEENKSGHEHKQQEDSQ